MGVFQGRGAPRLDFAQVAELMRPTLYATFNAHIQIFDPNTQSRTMFDPRVPGSGQTETELIFDSGPNGALIQPLRGPAVVTSGEKTTEIQGATIQTRMDIPGAAFRAGLRVVIVDGGNDDTLEGFDLVTNRGFDSSEAWGRILQVSIDAGNPAT